MKETKTHHFYEAHKRTLFKTFTYRLLIIFSTIAIGYVITGQLELTIKITVYVNILNTVLYYFHERLWNSVHWGKHKNI